MIRPRLKIVSPEPSTLNDKEPHWCIDESLLVLFRTPSCWDINRAPAAVIAPANGPARFEARWSK